jgi:hypothetical protein
VVVVEAGPEGALYAAQSGPAKGKRRAYRTRKAASRRAEKEEGHRRRDHVGAETAAARREHDHLPERGIRKRRGRGLARGRALSAVGRARHTGAGRAHPRPADGLLIAAKSARCGLCAAAHRPRHPARIAPSDAEGLALMADNEKHAAADDAPALPALNAADAGTTATAPADGEKRIAFQAPAGAHEHAASPGIAEERRRGTGLEMRRELTIEDKALAEAGYEHLAPAPDAPGKAGAKKDVKDVDLNEHSYSFAVLGEKLDTSIDTKDSGASYGLTKEEAEARLKRDGPNQLTPPKKKSAFRVVSVLRICACAEN